MYGQLFTQLVHDFPGAFQTALDLHFPKGLSRPRAAQMWQYLATFHAERADAQRKADERRRESERQRRTAEQSTQRRHRRG